MREKKSRGKRLKFIMEQRKITAATIMVGSLLLMFTVSPAAAFRTQVGNVDVTADITLGYGLSIATQDADPANLLGFDWPAVQNNPSSKAMTTWTDSGDTVSSTFKTLAEIGLNYENFGLVSNLSWFYDMEIMDRGTRREGTSTDTGLGDSWAKTSERISGSNFEVLDAYVFGEFEPAGVPVELRVGKQVINWGEGLFFFDGVSNQVPFNLAKLVLPGSEVKEAFIGVGAVYAQVAPTDNLALEAYYQYEWNEHVLPGVGTFYGDDLLGPGGREEWANWVYVPGFKGSNKDASSKGQWGVSGKYVIEDWELGLYYSRYHHFFSQYEFSDGQALDYLIEALLGDPEGSWAVGDYLTLPGFKLSEVFPEDQDMYGASFSTSLGMWSVNGEIAYRPDNVLMTDYTGYNALFAGDADFNDPSVGLFFTKNGVSGEEHDTVNASIHGLGYYGGGPLGIDTNFYMVQLGWDYIDGDLDNLISNYVLTDAVVPNPDEHAFGIAAQWDATWQNAIINNLDITTSIFAQYDFEGNSHYWGNFIEDRLMASFGVSGKYGTAWEAGVNYAMTEYMSDDYDSVYDRQDTINFAVNYKF